LAVVQGALHAVTDDGERAVEHAEAPLSPLIRIAIFLSLAAAALTAGNWQIALDFAESRTERAFAHQRFA
jgi:hypothetical protein